MRKVGSMSGNIRQAKKGKRFKGRRRGTAEEGERSKGRQEAPLFFVPLRLYHLVSPVHGQHLHWFQMLQTQNPAVARRWG